MVRLQKHGLWNARPRGAIFPRVQSLEITVVWSASSTNEENCVARSIAIERRPADQLDAPRVKVQASKRFLQP